MKLLLVLLFAVYLGVHCAPEYFNVTTDEYTGDPVYGSYMVNKTGNYFEMTMHVPQTFEWVGFHLGNIERRERTECIIDGNPCTEGYDFTFFPNDTLRVRFQHVVKFANPKDVVDLRPGAADCTPKQIGVGFCEENQAVISSDRFAFVVRHLEPYENEDFELVSNEVDGDYYVVVWRRSLNPPADGNVMMLRSAAKPRSYDAMGFNVLDLDYHGLHVYQNHFLSMNPDMKMPFGKGFSGPPGGMPQRFNPHGMPHDMHRPGMPQDLHRPGMPQDMHRPGMPQDMHRPGMPQDMHRPGMPQDMHRPNMPQDMHRPSMPQDMHRPGMPQDMHRPGMPEGMNSHASGERPPVDLDDMEYMSQLPDTTEENRNMRHRPQAQASQGAPKNEHDEQGDVSYRLLTQESDEVVTMYVNLN